MEVSENNIAEFEVMLVVRYFEKNVLHLVKYNFFEIVTSRWYGMDG